MKKPMIYKIVKYIKKDHLFNKKTRLYDLVIKEEYHIKRKGRIFGFWHIVGDWICDMNGDCWCGDDSFDTPEQAESYIKCWHEENYGDKYTYVVEPKIQIKK